MRGWLLLMAMVGCAPVELDDVETREQPLLGGLRFMTEEGKVCNDAQKGLLRAAWERGRRAVLTPEFEVCMRKQMSYDYLVCKGQDPFEFEPRSTQVARAIDASRTANWALAGCTAEPPSGASAYSYYGPYAHSGDEWMVFSSDYLDLLLVGPDDDLATESRLASIFWHEALHTHGYGHDQVGVVNCGWPWDGVTTFSQQYLASANEIVEECILTAARANGVTLHANGRGRRLGPGRYAAGSGIEEATALESGPGSSYALCSTCGEFDNSSTTLAYRPLSFHLDYLKIWPKVVVFDKTQYGGASRSLALGTHTAAALGQSIGNDAIRSLIVPAGVVAYACSDDFYGRGAGRCWLYESSAPDTSWMGGISYLEILPRVTTFSDTDFYGARQTFGVGTHTVVPSSPVRSIVVVPGQTAVACTAPPGVSGRFCATFTNSADDLGPELAGKVTGLQISSTPAPATYHVSAGTTTGGGIIASEPWGILCGEACSASFPAGSQLTLTATPSEPGATVTWQGCDSVVNGGCVLTVNRDRGVTATFVAACEPEMVQECEDGCYDSCAGRVTCIKRCIAGCSACN